MKWILIAALALIGCGGAEHEIGSATRAADEDTYPIDRQGYLNEFTPVGFSTHYRNVIELVGPCDGLTTYNYETVGGQLDTYGVKINDIPNGSLITDVKIQWCLGKRNTTGNATAQTFYRWNGVNSSMQDILVGDDTPTWRPFDYYGDWNGTTLEKQSNSVLEVGIKNKACTGMWCGQWGIEDSYVRVTLTWE